MKNLKLLSERIKPVSLIFLLLTAIFFFTGCRSIGKMVLSDAPEACQASNIPLKPKKSSSQRPLESRDSLQLCSNPGTVHRMYLAKRFIAHPGISRIKERFRLVPEEGKKGVLKKSIIRAFDLINSPKDKNWLIGTEMILIAIILGILSFELILAFEFITNVFWIDILSVASISASIAGLIFITGFILKIIGGWSRPYSKEELSNPAKKRAFVINKIGKILMTVGLVLAIPTFIFFIAASLDDGGWSFVVLMAIFLLIELTIYLVGVLLRYIALRKRVHR